MQIVIDIPKFVYDIANMHDTIVDADIDKVVTAIKKGMPLPKGHGGLTDKQKLFSSLFVRNGKVCPDTDVDNFLIMFAARDIKDAILNAPEIIEADGGTDNDES